MKKEKFPIYMTYSSQIQEEVFRRLKNQTHQHTEKKLYFLIFKRPILLYWDCFFLHILVKLEDQSKIEVEEVENKQPIMKTKQETTPQKARHSRKYPTAYLKKISQEMAKDEDDDNSNDAVLRKRILISTFCLSLPSLRSID